MEKNINIFIETFEGESTAEKIASLGDDRRSVAEYLVKIFNTAVLDGNFAPYVQVYVEQDTGKKLTKNVLIREYITKTVNEYTAIARTNCFTELKATADPMLEAVKRLTYRSIAVVEKKEGEKDAKYPQLSITDVDKRIDLKDLHDKCNGIGKDKNWIHMAEKFNFLLTVRTAQDIGDDYTKIADNYAMKEIASKIAMGATPTSNTAMLKQLQMVINAMIGEEYKATSHDRKFLVNAYSKKGKAALHIACSNHGNFRMILADICNHLVTGDTYKTDYKVKKA